MIVSRLIGLAGTLTVHLLVLFSFLAPEFVPPPRQPVATEDEDRSIPMDRVVFSRNVSEAEDSTRRDQRGDGFIQRRDLCRHSEMHARNYIGIGVLTKPVTGYVLQAPPGMPGYDAGIRVGDRIEGRIPHHKEPGNVIKVVLTRNSQRLVFFIKEIRLCAVEINTPPPDYDTDN